MTISVLGVCSLLHYLLWKKMLSNYCFRYFRLGKICHYVDGTFRLDNPPPFSTLATTRVRNCYVIAFTTMLPSESFRVDNHTVEVKGHIRRSLEFCRSSTSVIRLVRPDSIPRSSRPLVD